MSYQRLAYDDPDTRPQMVGDCRACASRFPGREGQSAAQRISMPAPSLRFEDFPAEVAKPEITIDQATAHLADRMHLHLD